MSFESPDYQLGELLKMVHEAKIQLPDFQRKWKWDNDRIRGLLASISLGHPVGVVMLLDVGENISFATELLSGVKNQGSPKPERLLLDGQQRLTSLYQSLMSEEAVETEDTRKKKMKVHYYINIEMAMDKNANREDAIIAVPQDRLVKEDFGRTIVADYSTVTKECESGMFPLAGVFDSQKMFDWLYEYQKSGNDVKEQMDKFSAFQKEVLTNITNYMVPAIVLGKDTSRDAVCTVFEKVNTGGVPLNVFELLTATFAMEGFKLKDDWDERRKRWSEKKVLNGVDNVDFLQSICLLATLERRASWAGIESEKPGVSCKKHDVLRLSLADYQKWSDPLTDAINSCASFLAEEHIFTSPDLPYRTQLVPLSVIRVLLKDKFNDHGVNSRIRQWYWCGVLGELYGGANETRFARDVEQVPEWAVNGGKAPGTVEASIFGDKRLLTLKSRNSAAYKGIYALLMADGCKDWIENKELSLSAFLEYKVDIHHIFPKAWCLKNNIDPHKRESIVNKTALSRLTNQKIGGLSPKEYVPRVLKKSGLDDSQFDEILAGHYVSPEKLREADFDSFFEDRFEALCLLVSKAMGKPVMRNAVDLEATQFEIEEDEVEDEDVDWTSPSVSSESA
jgi:hypothetical protein